MSLQLPDPMADWMRSPRLFHIAGDSMIGSGLQWVRRMKINEGNALGK